MSTLTNLLTQRAILRTTSASMRSFIRPALCMWRLSSMKQNQSVVNNIQSGQRSRYLSAAAAVSSSHQRDSEKKKVKIVWKSKGVGNRTTLATVGSSLLNAAREYDIDMEGACDGVCACSTCHVVLEPRVYDALEPPSEDEDDMLDQAPGLTSSSRLGCQVIIEEQHDGMVVTLPSITRNFYVDGHKPKHH